MIHTPARLMRVLLLAGVLLLIFALAGPLVTLGLINAGNLGRLRGAEWPAPYLLAARIAPNNIEAQLQAAEALARGGSSAGAAEIARAVLQDAQTSPDEAARAVALLVSAGERAPALQLYRQLPRPPTLQPRVAAALWLEATAVISEQSSAEHTLLWQAFGFPADADVSSDLKASLSVPTDARLREALMWRGTVRGLASGPRLSVEAVQVAPILGVAAGDLRLGPELIQNGGFEQFADGEDVPSPWRASFASTGGRWNQGAFLVGPDSGTPYSGKLAVRVDGMALDRRADREPARAGILYPAVSVEAEALYAVSFVYRTREVADGAVTLWLGEQPAVLASGDHFLPATAGSWRRATLVGQNTSGAPATINVLLRLWDEGSVWFDDVSVRKIMLEERSGLTTQLVVGEP